MEKDNTYINLLRLYFETNCLMNNNFIDEEKGIRTLVTWFKSDIGYNIPIKMLDVCNICILATENIKENQRKPIVNMSRYWKDIINISLTCKRIKTKSNTILLYTMSYCYEHGETITGEVNISENNFYDILRLLLRSQYTIRDIFGYDISNEENFKSNYNICF